MFINREKLRNEILYDTEYDNDTVNYFLGVIDSQPSADSVIKALKKQTPQKPTHEASLPQCFTCPTCKNVIDEFTEFIPGQPKIRVKTLHCKFCGQALDWEA